MTRDRGTGGLEDRAARVRNSLARLGEIMSDIVRTAEAQRGLRCPHRGRNDVCAYPGGCRNQVRLADRTRRCGGDEHVNWEPPPTQGWEPPLR
ncbi:MAG: hypothetical protein HUU25_11375 [Candidatus Sumerlaeia bacterium]|nr:hypothetical protein [Candidatus Sumerlaeia bacterium]